MPEYSYKAYDRNGTLISGSMTVEEEQAVLDELNRRGLLPFKTEQKNQPGRSLRHLLSLHSRGKLTHQDWAEFLSELSALVGAEVPLSKALELISTHSDNTRVTTLTQNLRAQVLEGKDLSASLETAAPGAPKLISSLIQAGEARGQLGPALDDLAKVILNQSEFKDELRGHLLYPVILLVAAIATVGILLTVMVPALLPLFEGAGAEPPKVLKLAQQLSEFLSNHLLLLSLGSMILFTIGFTLNTRSSFRQWLHGRYLRLPGLGRHLKETHAATFAKTLGALMKGGVDLISAVSIASNTVSNTEFAQSCLKATDQIRQGQTLSHSLKGYGVAPDLLINLITVGEESGRLGDMLLHAGSVLEKRVKRRLERFITGLGPALTIVIGIIVGALVLSVMQAILGLNDVVLGQ